jgi:hypothetical protein
VATTNDAHSQELASGQRPNALLTTDAFEQLAVHHSAIQPGRSNVDSERLRQVTGQLRDYAKVGGPINPALVAERDALQAGFNTHPTNDPRGMTPVPADQGIVPVAHLSLTHTNPALPASPSSAASNDADRSLTFNRQSPRGSGSQADPRVPQHRT